MYARLKDNIWAAVPAEIGSFVKCVIDVFDMHAWVKPLKDKKSKTVLYGFIEIVNKSKRKPKKIMGWLRNRILQ